MPEELRELVLGCLEGAVELVFQVIPEVRAVVDDVRLVHGEDGIAGDARAARQVAMAADRDQRRGGVDLLPGDGEGVGELGGLGPQSSGQKTSCSMSKQIPS